MGDTGGDNSPCTCGRSPTGKCLSWHLLSEQEYQEAKEQHDFYIRNAPKPRHRFLRDKNEQ